MTQGKEEFLSGLAARAKSAPSYTERFLISFILIFTRAAWDIVEIIASSYFRHFFPVLCEAF